jgi:hypothetical protein
MAQNLVPSKKFSDLTLVKLAREVAMNIQSIETILEANQIDIETWENIKVHPKFNQYLESETSSWNSAINTHERVKLKSAAVIEDWLPEAYARMHDASENLNAKTELGKLVARLAGMGLTNTNITDGSGERFSVTINLGNDAQLKFEKEMPMKTIDGSLED